MVERGFRRRLQRLVVAVLELVKRGFRRRLQRLVVAVLELVERGFRRRLQQSAVAAWVVAAREADCKKRAPMRAQYTQSAHILRRRGSALARAQALQSISNSSSVVYLNYRCIDRIRRRHSAERGGGERRILGGLRLDMRLIFAVDLQPHYGIAS